MSGDVTDDFFFGGRLRLLQPRKGHRFGGDAALLVAAARSRLEPGAAIVDLGAGVGPVGLALAASGARRATLVEIDPELSALSVENARRNDLLEKVAALAIDVVDVKVPSQGLEDGGGDLVVMNPPFDDAKRMRGSPDAARALAHVDGGDVIEVWTSAAERMLRVGGLLVMIHRADALPRLLPMLAARFGDLRVLPVHPKADAPAGRVLIAARKAGRGPLALLAALVMHGPDGRFTPEADAAQRGEAILDMS